MKFEAKYSLNLIGIPPNLYHLGLLINIVFSTLNPWSLRSFVTV